MTRAALPMLLLLSCSDSFRASSPEQEKVQKSSADGWYPAEEAQAPGSPAEPAPAATAMKGEGGAGNRAGFDLPLGRAGLMDYGEAERDEPAHEAAAPTRSWFPESFLWAPEVITDQNGVATVAVKVPDSLTTWRVLGLAWTAAGAQAGGTTTVLSTLPAYVDVAVPLTLEAGDSLDLPVQVVNTTTGALREPLTVALSGAGGGGSGVLEAPAGGTATRVVKVATSAPGPVEVSASFGGVDRVERTFLVRPGGEAKTERGAGAVGGPASAVPAGGSLPGGELVVTVWSGASSVIREELVGGPRPYEMSPRLAGDPLPEAAYHFALALEAGKLPPEDADPARVRELRIRAWQPLARAGRAPDTATACLLAEALGQSAPGTLEGDLAERMQDQVRAAQSPDGTWIVGASTIDGTLAAAAACARAAGEDDGVRLRVEGAFAREVARLEDPILAAWALASGSITDTELATRLRDTVHAAITRDANGAHLAGGGALNADGSRVGDAEATAVAALALADEPELAAALATGLLGERLPWGGWGSGRASLLALRALHAVFGDSPSTGAVELRVGGQTVATGNVVLGAHAPVLLRAPWSGSATTVEVHTSGAAPGLVYSWAATSYQPWRAAASAVAELTVRVPSRLRVGETAMLGVAAGTPSTVRASVVIGLPAGVRPDPAGMDSLRDGGAFASWESSEGTLVLRELPAGGWEGTLPVVPSFGGQLSSGSSALFVGGGESPEARTLPARWAIAGL